MSFEDTWTMQIPKGEAGHEIQLVNCLVATGKPVGLLLNLDETKVEASCHPCQKSVAPFSYVIVSPRTRTSDLGVSTDCTYLNPPTSVAHASENGTLKLWNGGKLAGKPCSFLTGSQRRSEQSS